jgi:hypothetical protein
MKKVIVTCEVKKTTSLVTLEKFETMADSSTINASVGMSSKKQLDGWAKSFFPAAIEVKFVSLRVIG